MARRVFFSFHYERDVWRANQVRNSWVTKEREAAGFWDGSLWEEAKKKGDAAIKKMIDEGLLGTSVTAVLIGAETADRKYVNYEIASSCERGNGLAGVYIHRLRDRDGYTDTKGRNPFDDHWVAVDGREVRLSTVVHTYDWALDDGYESFGDWVEDAAEQVGR